ncbi:MAG: transposase [Tannerellaceae bacterium]|nr:transposase [Tannerellaceae bacterium]
MDATAALVSSASASNFPVLLPGWISTCVCASNIWVAIRLLLSIPVTSLSQANTPPYLGKFRSGCAGASKHGLEISGIGGIDMDLHTCFHLEAVQTPPAGTLEQAGWTLVDWYLHVLSQRAASLLTFSRYVVADACFSKKKFADGLIGVGFDLISRLRDDAVLMYLTKEKPAGKRGRPKKYDGRIVLKSLESDRFEVFPLEEGQGMIYSAIVYAKALERNIRLCIWESEDKSTRKLYFSTDMTMTAMDVLKFYRCRFQVEFCFRDAKQFTGLTDAQSRDLNRLHFHFNAPLTSVNIAKAVAIKQGKSLSMATTKVLLHNIFLLQRFIDVSGYKPDDEINRMFWKEVVHFADIAA